MMHCLTLILVMLQVEAAYDMLLMQSLSQRRAGKVADSSIRYADVKTVKSEGTVHQWMQKTMKNAPVTFEAPSLSSLGIQSCIYGALMVFTYASGSSTSLPSSYTSPGVPGFILATGFGASLYFLAKKKMNLGKLIIHIIPLSIILYYLMLGVGTFWTFALRICTWLPQFLWWNHRNCSSKYQN
jgi:hypothetical protein